MKKIFALLLTISSAAVFSAQIPVKNGSDLAVWSENNVVHVAVSMSQDNRIDIFAETSPEKYDLQQTLSTPQPHGLLNGDFDGDGKNDLAVISTKRHLALFLHKDMLKPLVSYSGAMRYFGSPAWGKLDNSSADITHFGAGAVLWQLRKNRVLVPGSVLVPSGKKANRCLDFGDVDGDGSWDIVTLENSGKKASQTALRIYYGPISEATVKPEECSKFEEKILPFAASKLLVRDFNADGKAEIVVSGNKTTLIKTVSGDKTIDFGGILYADKGLLVIFNSTGARFYNTVDFQQVKSDKGKYRNVRIFNGKFYGLTAKYVRIYELAGTTEAVPVAAPSDKKTSRSAAGKRKAVKKSSPLLKFEAKYRNLSKQAVTVEDRLKNDPMMFPYYTGKILPTPQQVKYSDSKVAIDNTAIVLGKGLSCDDPRIKILYDRIVRYGGKCSFVSEAEAGKYPLVFAIGDTALTGDLQAPAKREGYAFKQVKPGIMAVKYFDKLALTWAMTSLAQLVDIKSFLPADVADYPQVARRGGSIPRIFDRQTNWSDYTSAELVNMAIYPKFNEFVFPYYMLIPNRGKDSYWRNPRPQKYLDQLEKIGKLLNPLGIEWYAGFIAFAKRNSPQQQEWMLDSKSDRDFQILYELSCKIADAGGNIFFYWEDHRKPIGKADKKNFGSAREADIFLINRLYKALRKKYPKLKFQFAGPFYHGPEGAPSPFADENRDDYFKGIGERFPKDIDICWTGPRVASTRVTREHMQWITGLIKRKPAFWQNSADFGRRPRVFYMGDKLNAWKTFYYDGFYDDITTYYLNYSQPCLSHPCADFLWNPQAYDAANSRDEVISRYVGKENLPLVMTMNKAMNEFNRYEFRVSPAAVRNLLHLKKNCQIAVEAYKEILRKRPAAEVLNMNFMMNFLNRAITFVDTLESRQSLNKFTADAEKIRQDAAQEAQYNTRSDLLFTAFDLDGSNPVNYKQRFKTKKYSAQKYCTVAFGKRTMFHTLSFNFEAIPWPAEDDYEIIICALDDDNPQPCPIRICINGKEVYKGLSPFRPDEWSVKKFRIPSPMIYRGNKVTIENLSDSDNLLGPPFICVSYVIMRKLDPQ